MAAEVLMPAAAAGMEQGRLIRWLKQEGDAVRKGEALAEVETDKAVMEIEAEGDGALGRILVPGDTDNVKVGSVIALLVRAGESLPEITELRRPVQEKPAPQAVGTPFQAPGNDPGFDRIISSPSARRLARERNVSLEGLKGSGPRGRIVRADVERASSPAVRSTATAPMAAHERIPHTAMRRTIARRLTESKQQIPHYYLSVDCRADVLLAARERLNERHAKSSGEKISVNDWIVAAVAKTLRAVPEVNAGWADDAILRWQDVDVSVAVSTDSGLITPIVRTADRKSLFELSRDIRELSAKARAGRLAASEYQGGSFTVSNLGMFGITQFAAVINPPQAAILAVGAVESRAVVEGDRVVPGRVLTLTLSADHRVIDGAVGARFLQELRARIEDPVLLVA